MLYNLLILKYALNLPQFVILGKNMTEQRLSRLLLVLTLSLATGFYATAQLWSTDFEGTNTNVSLNTGDLGGVGTTGSNLWIIDASYASGNIGNGAITGTPAQPSGITPTGQNYLHITSTAGQNMTPAYSGSHVDINAPVNQTYFSVISTGLNTSTLTDVQLSFYFLNTFNVGTAKIYARDIASTANWTELQNSDFTSSLSNTSLWTLTTYTGNLLNNLTNVELGVLYSFPGGIIQEQSFSIDDIKINSPADVVANVISPSPIPTAVCVDDIINFSAETNSAITSYQWNFNGANNGPQIVNTANATFQATSVTTPTTYNIELITSDGIVTRSTNFNITVNPCAPPVFKLVGDPRTICEGTSVNYQNTSTPGDVPIDSIVWTFPGGNPATSNLNNPTVVYNSAGVYNVLATLYDANGTYDTIMNAYINVISCPVPEADFQATATELCPGDCIGFIDNSTNMNGAGSTWLWEFPGSDSSTSSVQNPQNICYQEAGLYTVKLTVTNPNGVDIEEKLEYIQVDSCLPPRAQFTVERDSLCRNMCVQFFNRSLRADTIEWVFSGADPGYDTLTTQNPTVCYSDTGTFAVQLFTSNVYGEDIAIELDYIAISDYPNIKAGPAGTNDDSYTIYVGESTELEVFGTGTSYLWTPNVAINDPTSRFPTVNPTENTWYYATTTNDYGCSSTDSVRVLVRQEFYVGVPDIFSPNGDGENDELKVRGNGIQTLEFFVYNRYGQKVFESSNVNIGWDGSFNGEQANPGVFMYFARITYLNGFEEVIKGDVTLVR